MRTPIKRNHLFIPSRYEDIFEKKALERYQRRNRKRLTNHGFTIMANSCIGAQVYRDLNLRFDTPFVGSYMTPEDFVVFMSNPKYWVDQEIIEEHTKATCPVGLIGGKLRIFFVSDKSFEDGVTKWKYRKERIHWDNLFVMFNPLEQDFEINSNYSKHMCSTETIHKFVNLNLKNYVVITNVKEHILNNSCILLKRYINYKYPPYIGIISVISGKRIFDRYFDVVHWLNTNDIILRRSL